MSRFRNFNFNILSRFRKLLLFFCDSLIFLAVLFIFIYAAALTKTTPFFKGVRLAVDNALLLYGCTAFFQFVFHNYDSLWRYAESREYLSLLVATFCGFFSYEVLSVALFRRRFPFIYMMGVASTWLLGMLLTRFVYRVYRSEVRRRRGRRRIPAAIVGAGDAGVRLLNELNANSNSRYRVVCFFDDAPEKQRRVIHGVEVKGRISQIPEFLKALEIQEIIVAIPSAGEARRHEILAALSALRGVRVSVLPNTAELIGQKSISSQMREIRIEDLLERDPIRLDLSQLDAFLGGKTVLVTGGGGSIGSELCRQIAKHRPRRLVIVDIYENNAYDIQQELLFHYGRKLELAVEIASVRDAQRIRSLFEKYRPEIVFHAAAHKHVPLMESNPQEAVRNNVFGTLNMVLAADAFSVEKFVLISTDKAVNPTNVMGASKRLCEMIVQSMKGRSKTTYAAVRFGNVLGSNGSVVPLFRKQISEGGPVTITDKRIIRYFMVISEAAQLVLCCGAMARQNELYVLDMGRPVKILDLAENLIRLSGYVPYRDIDIVEIGLRPGEKLYEELLISSRDVEKTEHGLIFVEHQPDVTEAALEEKLTTLQAALKDDDPDAVRAALHKAVPSFREAGDTEQPQTAAEAIEAAVAVTAV